MLAAKPCIVAVVDVGAAGLATYFCEYAATVPPPLMVLHPNPVLVVQVSAFVAPEQLGTARPDGVVAVRAPSTVFALRLGKSVKAMLRNPGAPAVANSAFVVVVEAVTPRGAAVVPPL